MGGIVHVGMGKLESAVEDGRLSEDEVFRAHLIGFHDVLCTTEPGEVYHAEAVGEMSHQHLVPLAGIYFFVAQNPSFYLYVRHLRGEFADMVDLGAVYILIWIVFQQVTVRVDAELLAQYLFLLGTYAWQVHDVLI